MNKSKARVRWMIRRDMPSVCEIERECYDNPWSEELFLLKIGQRNCIGMVAEVDKKVVGFMVYELHKNRLHLLNIAVSPEYGVRGVGTALVDTLARKLCREGRNRIMVEVRETNLDAQLFFKRMGFKAISVLNNYYDDTDEDAYLMQYRVYSEVES